MKLALVHDYLIQMGGAERVVALMHLRYPDAPIFTSAVDWKGLWPEFLDADIHSTWMQHLPGILHHSHFKKYLPFYPLAFHFLSGIDADTVWISSSTFAKYIRVTAGVRTVCYLHNTTRFLWQSDNYLEHEVRHGTLRSALEILLPVFRKWDRSAAAKMDVVLANSKNVQDRIRRFYGLEARVIHPPVDTSRFKISPGNDGFYLVVSRLLGYKNIDVAVRAFASSGRRLLVVGEGPDRARLESFSGSSVEFLGRLDDQRIRELYSRCRGFLLPGEEDFGITPVEAMASGKPVIALGRGGALETVVEGETGIFFPSPEPEALLEAIDRSESIVWDLERIRNRALEFSNEKFLEKTQAVLCGS